MDKTCYNCGTEIAKEYCEGYPEVCEHWSPKKPMTNSDKIRQMSDEELAELLCSLCRCGDCVACGYCYRGHTGFIEWLRREADNG